MNTNCLNYKALLLQSFFLDNALNLRLICQNYLKNQHRHLMMTAVEAAHVIPVFGTPIMRKCTDGE